jgi:hypothetical protein
MSQTNEPSEQSDQGHAEADYADDARVVNSALRAADDDDDATGPGEKAKSCLSSRKGSS